MASVSGKVLRRAVDGSTVAEGPCQVTVGAESLTLVGGRGVSMACDLGDIEVLEAAEYELACTLYTGETFRLTHFGTAFKPLVHDLLEAWRERLVACLLLGDLPEVARFEATVTVEAEAGPRPSPAQIRLYETNVAVIPVGTSGFQWRLSDIDNVEFDPTTYTLAVSRGSDRFVVSKAGRRTDEFRQRLQEALDVIGARSLEAVRAVFPFLDPTHLAEAARLMREGRAAPVVRLVALDRRIEPALRANMADARLRPYLDVLMERSGIDGLYAGFRFIRPGEEVAEAEDEPSGDADGAAAVPDESEPGPEAALPADAGQEETPGILYWFFLAFAACGSGRPDTIAWESTSRSGRATYLFAPPAGDPPVQNVDAAVATLNRGLGALNFRRRPIYLPDTMLDLDPRAHRYAIAARRIPELRALRQSFRGRAIHASRAIWQQQLERAISGGS